MDPWLLERPALRLLSRTDPARPEDGVLASSSAEALSGAGRGVLPDRLFLLPPFSADAALLGDRCRFVAGGPEDLLFLEQRAEEAGADSLLKVGLRIQAPGLPPAGAAFLPEDLAAVSRTIRSLRRLTVRGCFFGGDLSGLYGESLGRFFRAGYETAKRMTVALPCAMPYICFENALPALRRNASGHPETLEACLRALDMVTMQNETAFYAKIYLS